MPTSHEVKRLKDVYGRYRQDDAVRQRWDAQNPGNRAIFRERREAIARWLQRGQMWPIGQKRILDVGCGSGRVLAGLLPLGASGSLLHGVDLLPERIEAAQKHFPNCHFKCTNAEELPYPDGHFDLVLAFTLFSSILDLQMARNVASEIGRVLQPAGAVLWYDFRYNNPRNANVRGMSRRRIAHIFLDYDAQLETITLLPPLARRLGFLTGWLYPTLAAVPWLRTHYIGLLNKPS